MPHKVEIPQYVIDRIMAKRGRLNVFETFDPAKTAFVIIDMQNFFVAEVETARSICPNINRLAADVRAKGGTVAWVVMTVADRPGAPSKWSLYHDYFFTDPKREAHKNGLTEGADGHAIYPDLIVEEGDLLAEKSRFSCFIDGASDLHEQLQAKGIENVLIAGTATNFCCETSARDAMMLDYKVIMVPDACAARYDEDHLVGLTSVWQSFGDLRTVDECISEVLREEPGRKAAQ